MSNFTHLHVHSEYSLLDGACRIKQLIAKVKDLGQKSIAITDHGVMYGVIEFYKEAKKQGIKPIIGCEVYVAARTMLDKVQQFDRQNYHLILLCKNNKGYENLCKIVSESWTSGFYNKPRVDKNLLRKYHDGIIALSGCLAGEVPRLLQTNDYNDAKKAALEYLDIFGQENFYLEIQNHNIPEQKYINPNIIKLSKETGIPLAATNDCHYINYDDVYMHKILLCIQTNHTIEDQNVFEFSSDQFYVKSEEEMLELFPECREAVFNTGKISDMCNVEIEFGNTKLPHFDVPDNKDHFEYFKEKCYEGLFKYYGKQPDKSLINRLEYELNIINQMGYVDYYLIVQDFVNYAKSTNIPVGPGRGSGAGSIAAYCIGITGVDPIKYNLLFERFLNPERVSMPDFDIDFCYERRQEVIDYVIKKYGKTHVSQIITFGTMAARAAIKDVGRSMAIPYSITDSVSKLIPSEIGMNIDKALSISHELKSMYEKDEKIKSLVDMARKLEGMPRHASTHAAGVVITRESVDNYVPLAKNDDAIVTQYTMTSLEELGLLKMDFLGLRTLTVINDAQSMIQKNHSDFKAEEIDEYDKDVFDMISRGETEGVFQFESSGMKSVLCQLKPESFEDLIAVISLYRPGPMDSISLYIQNRHNPENIKYQHPLLSKILDVTYGCIIYQEQVMQIFRELAGYSLGRADIVRRAMAKKKHDVMQDEHEIFINGLVDDQGNIIVDGCLRRGIGKEAAEKIYSQIQSFASYAFNKSHAAAYAMISYRTAWLKNKYPCEYMSALITGVLNYSDKMVGYISECRRLGIEVLSPNINESNKTFNVVNNKIRFGLSAIKGVSDKLIDVIIEERTKFGKFKSFYDFCQRIYGKELNKKVLENIIKSGAVDGLDANRKQMLNVVERIINDLSSDKRKNIEGQIGFFDSSSNNTVNNIIFPNVDEYDMDEMLAMEKDTIRMYVSGHPVLKYSNILEKGNFDKISGIMNDENRLKYSDKSKVKLMGVISNVNIKVTKNNNTMAFVKLEDLSGIIEVVIFSKVFSDYSSYVREGNVIQVIGNIKTEDRNDIKIICNNVALPEDNLQEVKYETKKQTENNNSNGNDRKGLYVKLKNKNCKEYDTLQLLLSIFEGNTPVYVFFEDTQKLTISPKGMWVSLNDVLIKELKYKLGEKNIVVKE